MARRRIRGPRFRRKTPTSWVLAVFDTTVQTVDSTLTEYALCESSDFSWVDPDGAVSGLAKTGHVLRSLGNFTVSVQMQSVAFTQASATLFWAVYVLDSDDPDSDLTATAGPAAILNKARVIQTGCEDISLTEIPAANYSGAYDGHGRVKISWDVKARIRLKPDDDLILGIQTTSSLAAVAQGSVGVGNGIARTLIRTP